MVAKIEGVSVLTRSDKRKDRVEISPEQLAAASSEAEKISQQLKKTTRVIGWYHSHPHITVQPSHIDVDTQAQYQMLDVGFVGLIFSCFNTEAQKKRGRVQIIAFQSLDLAKQEREREKDANNKSPRPPQLDEAPEEVREKYSVNIPGGPFAELAVTYKSITEKRKEPFSPQTPPSPTQELIGTLSPVRKSGFQQIDIPIYIVPASSRGPRTLDKLVQLQRIMFGEERASYFAALQMGTLAKSPAPGLTRRRYEKALCRLIEMGCSPLLQALQDRQASNLERIARLEEEKRKLMEELGPETKKTKF